MIAKRKWLNVMDCDFNFTRSNGGIGFYFEFNLS